MSGDDKKRIQKKKRGNTSMNKTKFFCRIAFILIAIITCILCYSTASYKQILTQKGSAKIAKPIIDVIYSEKKNIENINPETVYESFTFRIINYKGEEINEVPIQCEIRIVSDSDVLPVQYKIIEIESQKEVKEKIEIKANEKEIKNYRLELIWNTNAKIAELKDENNIKIQVDAIQLQ